MNPIVTGETAGQRAVEARAGTGRPAAGGWALVALLGAMFLGNIDIAVANIAAPAIGTGLRASGGELELIVSGYPLAYAVLLITSARLGDVRGYRRTFLTGLAWFVVASLACGLAPDAALLAVARVAAGAAAALMAAQVLTGIQLGYTGRARARALGLYSVVLSAGAVAGQSLGGLLISADVLGLGWRSVFLVNVPIGVLLHGLARRFLPAGRRLPGRLDLTGVAVLSVALLLLVVPLVFGRDAGWPVWLLACLAASVPAFAWLWLAERRISAAGRRPLIDPRLIARPAIGWGLTAQSVATATYFGMLFTAALYVQQGLGKSAAYSGLVLVPWVAAFGLPGLALSRFPARTRALAAPVGGVILGAGFGGLAAVLAAGDTGGTLLMALLGLGGLGLGTMFTGMLSHLTGAAGEDDAAGVSGLFNTTTRAGGVLGTAAFGTFYLALVRTPHQAVHGFAALNLVLTGTALAAAGCAALAVRRRPTTPPR